MSAWRKEWDEPEGRVGDGGGMLSMPPLPVWTKRLLLFNLVVFIVLFLTRNAGTGLGLGNTVTSWLSINTTMWWTEPPFVPIWQVLTYGFLHDLGGFGHILFNSLALFFFGAMLERSLGANRFLVVYFGALLLGGVVHVLLSAFGFYTGYVVGASGAIMGVIVAAAALFPNAQVLFIFIPMPLYLMAGGLVVMDLLMFTSAGSGTAHDVHLAGALFGFLYIKRGWHHRRTPEIAELPGRLKAQAQAKREQRALGKRQADEERLDALLERINREGMSSLTDAEKAFLKQMSKRT